MKKIIDKKITEQNFMNPIIKTDILSIISETRKVIEHNEIAELKEISNHTIHNASIFQDKDSITIAIIVYSLYKILSSNSSSVGIILKKLYEIENALAKEDYEKYHSLLKNMLNFLSKKSKEFKKNITEVIRQAQIKKGSKLYDHGISISKAADLLGISVWELMNYIGKTEINNTFNYGVPVNKRISYAKKIFK